MIHVDIDYGKIERSCKEDVQRAQKWLDNEIIKDCQPFLPFLTGELQDSTSSSVLGSGIIEYDVPYARRLYYGVEFNFSKRKHPLAGPYWFEYAKSINKDKWIKGVNEVAKQ